MPQLTQNLIRLDASAYHGETFLQDERAMVEQYGISYFFGLSTFLSKNDTSQDSEIIVLSNTHSLPSELPSEVLNKTRLWIHSNSGYDNFNASFVTNAQFPILTGNTIRSNAVCEYILAQTFEHFGLAGHQEKWDRTRSWSRALLKEKNILICGEGIVGKILKDCLTPLAKNISTFDPYKNKSQTNGLEQFLSTSPKIDIVLLACSLNSTSRKLIDENILSLLSDDFLLINAARGELIDEAALLKTLAHQEHAYAVLDVFENEPTSESFISLKNLKRTSHIAGVSKNLDQLILNFESEILSDFFNNRQTFANKYENFFLSNRIDRKNKELI